MLLGASQRMSMQAQRLFPHVHSFLLTFNMQAG